VQDLSYPSSVTLAEANPEIQTQSEFPILATRK
jgi:hypothetical protein